jgi:hypothetical protein
MRRTLIHFRGSLSKDYEKYPLITIRFRFQNYINIFELSLREQVSDITKTLPYTKWGSGDNFRKKLDI